MPKKKKKNVMTIKRVRMIRASAKRAHDEEVVALCESWSRKNKIIKDFKFAAGPIRRFADSLRSKAAEMDDGLRSILHWAEEIS